MGYTIKVRVFGPGYEAEIYCEETGLRFYGHEPTPKEAVATAFERLEEKENVVNTYIRNAGS